MHVSTGSPEIVHIGKPSILNIFILQDKGLAATNNPSPGMAEHRLLPREPRDRLQSSKSTALNFEVGKGLVDPLKRRLKPRKTSSDSESVNGSESDSVASDADSGSSSNSQGKESSNRNGNGDEEDLEVRVNLRYLDCCEHRTLNKHVVRFRSL